MQQKAGQKEGGGQAQAMRSKGERIQLQGQSETRMSPAYTWIPTERDRESVKKMEVVLACSRNWVAPGLGKPEAL